MLEKVGLRYHFWSTIEQDLEEPERPGRQRNRPAMATQHMTDGIELAVSEGNSHVSAKELGFRENSERTTHSTPGYSATGGES